MKIKKICCIGAGYVGGPTMAVIALKCPNIKVTVVDSNPDKIESWNGNLDYIPVHEPGLKEVLEKVRGKNLFFSTEIDNSIDEAEMIFMAVNTPTKTEGEGAGYAADLTHIKSCARRIARVAKTNKIIVEKSTLPVRTAEKIKQILNENHNNINFEVLSNPEFLAEGTAISDLFKSDRVLIGGDSTNSGKNAIKALVNIYKKWIPKEKILITNVWSSELSKLASNAMLAQRISSINALSALCEKTDADIDEVSMAIGMDHRIGPKFLKASVGFGGSCFQKDILNLVYLCRNYGLNEVAEYWHQVIKINNYQRNRFAEKIIKKLNNNLIEKKISLLGWSFKKDTNDSRESSAIYVADKLLNQGAEINIYDPMVDKNKVYLDLKTLWESRGFSESIIDNLFNNVVVHNNYLSSMKDTSAIAIITEWDEFKEIDWEIIKTITKNSPTIFDGRRIIKNSKSFPIERI